MSEQDFFFDEEPEVAPEPPKAKAPRAAKSDAPVSEKPAPRAAKTTAKPVTKVTAKPVIDEYEPEALGDPQSTTWTVAILLALVALLLGAILGFFLGSALGKPAASGSTAAPVTQTPATGAPSALTSEQVNAGLPAGHPPINTSSTVETTGK